MDTEVRPQLTFYVLNSVAGGVTKCQLETVNNNWGARYSHFVFYERSRPLWTRGSASLRRVRPRSECSGRVERSRINHASVALCGCGDSVSSLSHTQTHSPTLTAMHAGKLIIFTLISIIAQLRIHLIYFIYIYIYIDEVQEMFIDVKPLYHNVNRTHQDTLWC